MSYLSDLLGKAFRDDMTLEDVSKALEEAKVGVTADNSTEIEKLKASLSRANSEAKGYKDQLRAKQTEEEAAQQEIAEKLQALATENETLKRNMELTKTTSELVALGYDTELATKTATAMLDGDLATVIKNQSSFLETQMKNLKADQMRNAPRPAAGSATAGVDYGKMIAEAQASGDYSAAAYYTRLQAQETLSGDNE